MTPHNDNIHIRYVETSAFIHSTTTTPHVLLLVPTHTNITASALLVLDLEMWYTQRYLLLTLLYNRVSFPSLPASTTRRISLFTIITTIDAPELLPLFCKVLSRNVATWHSDHSHRLFTCANALPSWAPPTHSDTNHTRRHARVGGRPNSPIRCLNPNPSDACMSHCNTPLHSWVRPNPSLSLNVYPDPEPSPVSPRWLLSP